MPMKKYLLFVWIAVVFCSCNEDNFDISPMEADATCANIIDDEHFVSVSQASKVGSLFLNNNGNGNCVHTRNSSVVPEATSDKTAREIRTIYNENGKMMQQIHNGDHGNRRKHPFGQQGEHAHDFKWAQDGGKPDRTPRELADEERKGAVDILKAYRKGRDT